MIKKIVKIFLITIGVVIAVMLVTVVGAVWYLTSDRLTPMVVKEVNKLIDGEVTIERVDLTLRKDFPKLRLEVDSLCLVSHSLHNCDDSLHVSLPADADSLVSIGHLEGGINLIQALRGKFEIYNVIVERLKLNIVIADEGHNNFAILASDDTDNDKDNSRKLPPISIDRFRLVDAGPLKFTSLPDSLSFTANLHDIGLTAGKQPIYDVTLTGGASSHTLEEYSFNPIELGINGKITWSADRAGLVMMDRINLSFNEFSANIDATVDMTEDTRIDRLNISASDIAFSDIINHLPAEYHDAVKGIESDMKIDVAVSLTAPYFPADTAHLVPSLKASITIPQCHLNWRDIHFNTLALQASCSIDGREPDLSSATIESLLIHGRAMDINLSGTATGPLNDPFIDASLIAALKLHRLPGTLLEKLPMEISGRLQADTDLRFHLNDFTHERFHRAYLDGTVTLSDIDIKQRDSTFNFFTPRATLDLGTSRKVKGQNGLVDSLLTVRLDMDTASIDIPGLNLQASKLTAGLGSTNRSNSSDTTIINPFGGIISLASFSINQPHDSLTVRFRDVSTHASLTRYKGNMKTPQVDFNLTARRFATRMPDFGIVISQPEVIVNAHLIEQQPGDTTKLRLTGRQHINERDTIMHDDLIDWNTSKGFKRLLLRWDINGSLKSNRGFVSMRSFPLRQRASEIEIKFNNDTVDIVKLDYSAGNSLLDIKGQVSNMKRAFAGRSGRAKLKGIFGINAPYIDINELATATFYQSSGNAGPDADYDEEFYDTTSYTDTTERRPFIIPRNIDMDISLTADTVMYADMLMNRLTGELRVNNSAVNLHNLKAITAAGSANLSALYWAPNPDDMEFGLGLQLNNFDIGRVLKMIPAIDSLLPAMRGLEGVINAEIAATSSITPQMDIDIPSFKGAIKIQGDSLVLLDADTFKKLSKWLMFKNKKRNMIDHMNVEIVIDNSIVEIFPFIFDIDRYRLGVMGRNNLDLDLDYHVSVLKSPLPFKFGINIRGPLDDFKISLGGAKIKPGDSQKYDIADTTRVNLINKIEEVFKRGVINQRSITMTPRPFMSADSLTGELSAQDSLLMMREGLLPPDTVPTVVPPKKRPLWKRISF